MNISNIAAIFNINSFKIVIKYIVFLLLCIFYISSSKSTHSNTWSEGDLLNVSVLWRSPGTIDLDHSLQELEAPE